MKYRELIKNIKFNPISEQDIEISSIKFQYNYDRFDTYKKTVSSKNNCFLDIKNSPHVDLLNKYNNNDNIDDSNYYQMQKLYGKKDLWIKEKINKFIKLYESIKLEGYQDLIEVLETPITPNKYNNKYEIYEGHHRCSCLYVLGYKAIRVKLLEIVK